MTSRHFAALLLTASACLAAGPALAQDLKVRAGTQAVEGAPGSLQNVAAPAPVFGPKIVAGFKPPLFNGKPDFTGVWNNETLTGIERSPAFGTRAVLTDGETRVIEGANDTLLARANAPTKAGATIKDIESLDSCSGGRPWPVPSYSRWRALPGPPNAVTPRLVLKTGRRASHLRQKAVASARRRSPP